MVPFFHNLPKIEEALLVVRKSTKSQYFRLILIILILYDRFLFLMLRYPFNAHLFNNQIRAKRLFFPKSILLHEILISSPNQILESWVI